MSGGGSGRPFFIDGPQVLKSLFGERPHVLGGNRIFEMFELCETEDDTGQFLLGKRESNGRLGPGSIIGTDGAEDRPGFQRFTLDCVPLCERSLATGPGVGRDDAC